MHELVSALILGAMGSAHCVGMCGGFAAAIAATDQPLLWSLTRQIVYSLGRLCTYAFLGAVGGFAGLYLSQFDAAMFTAQQVFSIVAGVIMLAIGVSMIGIVRLRWLSSSGLGSLVVPAFRHFLNARGWLGFFLGGLANGFLPCGLVYAALAMAVGTRDVVAGMTLMGAFGLGTVPAMAAVGCGSTLLGHAWRGRVVQLAGCFLILSGAVTIWRASVAKPDACCTVAGATAPYFVGLW